MVFRKKLQVSENNQLQNEFVMQWHGLLSIIEISYNHNVYSNANVPGGRILNTNIMHYSERGTSKKL